MDLSQLQRDVAARIRLAEQAVADARASWGAGTWLQSLLDDSARRANLAGIDGAERRIRDDWAPRGRTMASTGIGAYGYSLERDVRAWVDVGNAIISQMQQASQDARLSSLPHIVLATGRETAATVATGAAELARDAWSLRGMLPLLAVLAVVIVAWRWSR